MECRAWCWWAPKTCVAPTVHNLQCPPVWQPAQGLPERSQHTPLLLCQVLWKACVHDIISAPRMLACERNTFCESHSGLRLQPQRQPQRSGRGQESPLRTEHFRYCPSSRLRSAPCGSHCLLASSSWLQGCLASPLQ